ncbi:MAG: class I SAM-dependent methyltransferase [Chlamydiales bacterium]
MDIQEFYLMQITDGEDKSSPIKNRIRKNYRHLRKWAKRTTTNCFRIYDRDIKMYPLAIDFYAGKFCVYFFSSNREETDPPLDLQLEINEVLQSIFNIKQDDIYWKSRIKRKRYEQYEKHGNEKAYFSVLEYGVKFKINLTDYLDTGLFLDHRETRQVVAKMSKGKRLLNLFAYTCSFSVHAAVSGAIFTKSVDMSNTYTEWGKDNFIINNIPLQDNPVIREDCFKFLNLEVKKGEKYDVIVIDPPTISRSKKMECMFDIQKDYIILLNLSLQLLDETGVIIFSTNSRKFSFDSHAFPNCIIEDISEKTVPMDFQRKIHRCWKIRTRNESG